MKKSLKTIVSLFGGLFILLGVGASSGKVEASVGPTRIENITDKTPLYLTPAQTTVDGANVVAGHYSHSSHESHSSHVSHSSHRSGY